MADGKFGTEMAGGHPRAKNICTKNTDKVYFE